MYIEVFEKLVLQILFGYRFKIFPLRFKKMVLVNIPSICSRSKVIECL